MPDQPDWASEERQVELLTRALAHMPHPGRHELDVPIPAGSRRPFAEMAYRKGVRVFPELAVVETVTVGEEHMGAYAASRTLPVDVAAAWKLLKDKDPGLYERIRAAETEEERAALAAELAPGAKQGIAQINAIIAELRGEPS